MPYASVKDVPDYVPGKKKAQWREVWNSAYEAAIKDGKSKEDAESKAFAEANGVAGPSAKEKAMIVLLDKVRTAGIRFTKIDPQKREVWGPVTAEAPDKDEEICDYEKSKPYYMAVISEMEKATDGENKFPLREMHQLVAAGKCIGYEFRDADRMIYMGFKVVDDAAWDKCVQRVYTGFSQGGRKVGDMVPDPIHKNCMRYVANPSEVSLVDKPCLALAHIEVVKADGSIELRKTVLPIEAAGEKELRKDLEVLRGEIELLKASTVAKGKTKRVAGEDLPASAFLLVGDADKTDTWNLPVKFSSEAKSKRHIRNALARINQVKGHSKEDIEAARKKLHALAEKHGISVEEEKKKLAAVQSYLRKQVRISVNRAQRKADIGPVLSFIDHDLGKLQKGMYEVSRLAEYVQGMSYMLYSVVSEQEWEKDTDSVLPAHLLDNVNDLIDILIEMVQEETTELKEEIDTRVHVA